MRGLVVRRWLRCRRPLVVSEFLLFFLPHEGRGTSLPCRADWRMRGYLNIKKKKKKDPQAQAAEKIHVPAESVDSQAIRPSMLSIPEEQPADSQEIEAALRNILFL